MKPILVTGDIIRDVYIYQGDRLFPAQQGKIPPFLSNDPGGAVLLKRIIEAAVPGSSALGYPDPIPEDLRSQLQSVHTLWSPFDEGTKKESEEAPKNSKPKKVWRVAQSLGYELGVRQLSIPPSQEAGEHFQVLVLDDAGLSFRNLPSSKSWPNGVQASDPQPEWIIHKMANPIAQGDLWRELIGGPTPAPRKNLLVIVSADELRRAGAAISRGFCWERTLTELCHELNSNPHFHPLLQFPQHLIVNFGCVGAIWFGGVCAEHAPNAPAHHRATLVYDPSLPEGDWKHELADPSQVYGHLNTFTAAIAIAAMHSATGLDLNQAIKRGLTTCRQLRLLGHGPCSAAKPGIPFPDLAPLLSPSPADLEAVQKTTKKLVPHGFQIVPAPCGQISPDRFATWTLAALAENPPDQPDLPLYGLAHRVALYGFDALQHIPHARFGDLLSVDRQEIETLRSLRQLIKAYESNKKQDRPLSLAAFGPPGAGKSFGIKQIAKEVLGKDVPILEFNLSQFNDPEDLFGAFHQVRDKVLQGHTPVVFWDEFDSRNYDWLQYLLAPMQDGNFVEKGHTHTLGRCLFVFAGGTSWDFEHFGPAPVPEQWDAGFVTCESNQRPKAIPDFLPGSSREAIQKLCEFYRRFPDRHHTDQSSQSDFVRKKGPDFLSRLDGYINVLGPNRRRNYDWSTRFWTEEDPIDITFPVRRALLLRQFLGAKKPGDQLDIDRDLLRAFLHVPRYRHGARSMEKVAKPLASSIKPFRRALMPPPQVLAQHLDTAADFDAIYNQNEKVFTPDVIEELAKAIHDAYGRENPAYASPYAGLSAFLQASNRAAALRMPHILILAGITLVSRPTGVSALDFSASLSEAEESIDAHLKGHLEILAIEEHRLWQQFHETNGWQFGFKMHPKTVASDPDIPITPYQKDKDNLRHPCLKPFHEMPDEHGQRSGWQELDRNSIRSYTRMLRLTNFQMAFLK